MQTRQGLHLTGDGTVGRKDANQALNQYILWKQKNDKWGLWRQANLVHFTYITSLLWYIGHILLLNLFTT